MKLLLQKFSKFRIPTLLGIGLILVGIISGVFLVLKDQPFFAKADIDIHPEPIVTNVLSNSVTVSFKTDVEIPTFISYGPVSPDQTVSDDRDIDTPPTPRKIHYFTIKNLQPDTSYQYNVAAGNTISKMLSFKTAKVESLQNGFSPVIGTVTNNNGPLTEGLVYLLVSEADTQSALVKNGSFLIPLSFMRRSDFSDVLLPEELTPVKLTVDAPDGQAIVLFHLKPSDNTIGLIKLGDTLDLTDPNTLPKATSSSQANDNIFDLNGDGEVNTADNAIILKNFGNNPSDKRADLDGNGEVDNEDLKIMSEKINQ